MHALVVVILLVLLATWNSGAQPRENDAWEEMAPSVRQWFRSLMQPDNPNISCCGEADAYFADGFETARGGEYIAIITDTRDVPGRPPIKPGTRIVVPHSKLKYDAGNPTGHGVIFVRYDSDEETFAVLCYVAPGGV